MPEPGIMRASFIAVALSTLAACGQTRVEADLPLQADTRALIVAILHGGMVDARAISVDNPANLPALEDFEDDVQVIALLYPVSLEELGIPAGPLPVVGVDQGRALPTTKHMFVTGVPVSWSPIPALPEVLANMRIAGPRCPNLDTRSIDLGVPHNMHGLMPMDDGKILIIAMINAWTFNPDETLTEIDFPFPVRVSIVAQHGNEIYAGGYTGDVYRATYANGRLTNFRTLPPAPEIDRVQRIAGIGDEVYTLTERGAFERFDGQAWTTLHESSTTTVYAGVEVLALGHAVAAGSGGVTVVRYRDGVTTVESLPGAHSGISALGRAGELGVVAAPSQEGTLFIDNGTGFDPLPNSRHSALLCGITGFQGGVFGVGRSGSGVLWMPKLGICFDRTINPVSQHFAVTMPNGDLISLGDREDARHDGTTLITVVTAQR